MSLLMDALRKAEEAKKQAERNSKSKLDAAELAKKAKLNAEKANTGKASAAGKDAKSLDFDIDFDAPAIQQPEAEAAIDDSTDESPAPDQSEPFDYFANDGGPLADDSPETLAKDTQPPNENLAGVELAVESGAAPDEEVLDAADPIEVDATQASATEYGVADAESIEFFQDHVDAREFDELEAEADPEATAATAPQAPERSDSPSGQADTHAALESESDPPDEFSIDYAPTKPAVKTEAKKATVPRQPAAKSAPPGQRFETPRQAGTYSAPQDEDDLDLEEEDRRSALNVFAVKRGKSAMRKNLQLTALSIAAVMLVSIGIYFYISLRTSGGITLPVAGVGIVPEPAEIGAPGSISDAVAEPLNTAINVTAPVAEPTIEVPLIVQSPAAPAIAEVPQVTVPPASARGGVTLATIGNDTVSATAEDSVLAEPVQTPVPAAPISPGVVITDTNAPRAPSTAPSQSLPDPVTIANNDAGPDDSPAAPANRSVSQAGSTANRAGELQPEQIEPESLVSFTRKATTPTSNPLLLNAYSAYQNGDMERAERLYREVLVTAPLNRSALLGMAAIAAGRNDTVAALELYSRLLARDPSDPVARAGLLEIMPRGNLQQQELELKRLQQQHPDMAPLAYAMGNFMASQQRWSEAQQAYFSALQLAKNATPGAVVNPDYAFNLAVSLEHLGQSRSASNYYREALTLAEGHPAGFNLAIARERLSSMESPSNE